MTVSKEQVQHLKSSSPNPFWWLHLMRKNKKFVNFEVAIILIQMLAQQNRHTDLTT